VSHSSAQAVTRAYRCSSYAMTIQMTVLITMMKTHPFVLLVISFEKNQFVSFETKATKILAIFK
jgi:hypothetical protein